MSKTAVRSSWRGALVLSSTALATLGGVLLATPATAQEAGAAPQADETGDIVVTAQKQSSTAQRTPAAITAITGSELVNRGVNDINAAQDLVPSVRFQQQSASTEIFIRGVGGSLDYSNIEPTTNFNFNGVYVPREGTSVPLYDIAQLEVLPGPQGTLYGRGAVGGVVNVNFARPTDKYEAQFTLEAGNYDLVHPTAVLNVPVSDTLALRGAIDYTHRNGYLKSGADSRKDISGRLSLLFEPNAGTSIYLWGYAVDKGGSPSNAPNHGFDPVTFQPRNDAYLRDDPWDDRSLPVFTAAFGTPRAEDQHYRSYMAGGQIDLTLSDAVTLSFIPSWFKLDWNQDYWVGALPASGGATYRQVTGELRLAYKKDRLSGLLGFYGYRSIATGFNSFAGFFASSIDRNRIQGVSIFGEATYELTDTLRLTGGARYSIDDRVGRGNQADFTGVPSIPYGFDHTFRHFDWKAGVQFDLAPASMLYATVQTGYQPGTFNEIPNSATFDNLVKSAELTAYTAGIKNRLFDNVLQLNIEGFYYDYRNLFQQAFDVGVVNPVFNAKKVEVYGVQIDSVVRISPRDNLTASVGYLHGRTVDFTTPSGATFNDVQLAMSPEWTASASYYHDFTLANGYVRASGDTRYSSSFCSDFTRTIGTCQKKYMKSNASLTYFDDGGRWSLGVWIKNIENKAIIARAGIGGLPGPAAVFLENPRTYGVRLGFKM